MHHEKRVVILIGILSGICISLGFIRPFDGVITLSELVLQLSGSRGELSMSCNLVELIGFMLRMMPNYIMILVFGNKLYGHFCTASIYVFSRCPNRMKWYGKELLQLINLICIFELVFLSTTAIASVLRYQVIFSVGGFILLGCHALIFMLWNFTLVLLVNLLAINIGSSAAFTLVMVVQMTCTAALSIINILTKIQIKQDIIDVFLWLNPVAHTVLGWHRSTLLEVELANSRYSLNLVTSILIPALFCIVTVPENICLEETENLSVNLPQVPVIIRVSVLEDVEHIGGTSRQLVKVEDVYKGTEPAVGQDIYLTCSRWSLSLYSEPYSIERGFVNIMEVGEEYLVFIENQVDGLGEKIPVYQVYVENAFTPIFSYQEHENNICETGGESTYVKYNQVCENEFFATTQKGMDALVGLKNEMIEKYNEK